MKCIDSASADISSDVDCVVVGDDGDEKGMVMTMRMKRPLLQTNSPLSLWDVFYHQPYVLRVALSAPPMSSARREEDVHEKIMADTSSVKRWEAKVQGRYLSVGVVLVMSYIERPSVKVVTSSMLCCYSATLLTLIADDVLPGQNKSSEVQNENRLEHC